jgi:hypothetical protein
MTTAEVSESPMEFTASEINANDPPTIPPTSLTIPNVTFTTNPSTAA